MNTTIKNNWYQDFFSGLNCEMWQKATTPELTDPEVNFLQDVLNCEPGNHLLDVPCGAGRHAVELAKRGFNLTGVDISTEFLQTLRERVENEQLSIQLIHGDVITTRLETLFDGAYCMGNSFGYVDYAGMTRFVGNVSAALKPGARFVINSGLIAESILPNFPKAGHYVLGDLTMAISNSYVVEESYMATELTYTKAERTEIHRFKHYMYTLSEVKRLLSSHGLETVAIYSSTEKQPYQLGDRQIYLVAEKR